MFVYIYRFPSHTVGIDAKRSERERVLSDLKKKLKNEEVQGVCVYFVTLPMESVHNHKLIGATRRMNPRIREKILEFVSNGITSVKVIKKLLRKYALEEFVGDPVKPHPGPHGSSSGPLWTAWLLVRPLWTTWLNSCYAPMDHMAPRYIGPPWTTWLLVRPLWTTWLNSCYAPMDHMAPWQAPSGLHGSSSEPLWTCSHMQSSMALMPASPSPLPPPPHTHLPIVIVVWTYTHQFYFLFLS